MGKCKGFNPQYFNNNRVRLNAGRVANRRDADNLISGAYSAFHLLGIMALRDEYGFGTVRLERWLDKMKDLLDSYNRGYISVADLHDTIKAETGIEVKI